MNDDVSTISQFADQAGLPAGFTANAAQYFVPLAIWLDALAGNNKALVAGVNGAQGSGKTTLARLLKQLLIARGKRVAMLSLDDFYLPRVERARLAVEVHPLLATRGVPGTHDLALLANCIDRLAGSTEATNMEWPRFDKASDDRAAGGNSWKGTADIVLVEGWCVGTPAEVGEQLQQPVNELERDEDPDGRWRRIVNELLATSYRDAWQRLDVLCFLQVPDFAAVRRWRWQQEQELAAGDSGHAIMTEAALEKFLQHFERLTLQALRVLPGRADWKLLFDAQHLCTRSQAQPGTTAASIPR